MVKPIDGLKRLLDNKFISLAKIEWWLLKYVSAYQDVISIIEAISPDYVFPSIGDRYALEFQLKDLYELLEEVSVCHRNEAYFKKQLALYDEVSNNVTELSSWLESHKLTASEEQIRFLDFFADNRELSGYRSKVIMPSNLDFSIRINLIEFEYTLRFLDIVERSGKLVLTGIVKLVKEVEFLEEIVTKTKECTSTRPAYQRQHVVIATNDAHRNEHLIRFVHGKTELLKDITVGQKVKVYTDLRGGELEKESGVKEYWNSLIGWDIQILEDCIYEAEL